MVDTRFNLIKRNDNGALIVEYEIFKNVEIDIPLDDTGNEIRGDELRAHIQGIVNSLAGNTVFLDPDLNIAEELGLLPEVIPDSNTVIDTISNTVIEITSNTEIVSNTQPQYLPEDHSPPITDFPSDYISPT